RQQNVFCWLFSFILSPNFDSLSQGLADALVNDDGATPERRVCRFYAGGLYDGRGGGAAGTDAESFSQPGGGGAAVLGRPVLYRERHRRDPGEPGAGETIRQPGRSPQVDPILLRHGCG